MTQYGQTAVKTVNQDGVAKFEGMGGFKLDVNMRQGSSGDWRAKSVSVWLKQKITEHPGMVFNRNPTCAKGTLDLSSFTTAVDKPASLELEPKMGTTASVLLPGTHPVFNYMITGSEKKVGHEE